MRRQQQFALPLGQVEPSEDLMRAAYERERRWLKRGFEDVMQIPHFRICLRNLALVMAKRGGKQR